MYTGSASRQSKSLTAAMHDRHVNVIRDANAHVMAVKGRKMWCVIWCDRGWRIRMPVLLQIVIWRETREGLGWWDDRRGGGDDDVVYLVDRVVVDGVVDRVVDCAA
jgi:hypothetical protein